MRKHPSKNGNEILGKLKSFVRDENGITLKMKRLAQFPSKLAVSRLRKSGRLVQRATSIDHTWEPSLKNPAFFLQKDKESFWPLLVFLPFQPGDPGSVSSFILGGCSG